MQKENIMNTDKDEAKQLHSELHCRATAHLQESIMSDLKAEDKSLGELIDDAEGKRPKDSE
jgi:hypothetical protein